MGILNKIPASFEGLESYEHYLEYMRDHINEMSFEKFKQYESHRLGEEAQRLKKAIIILKQLESMNQLKWKKEKKENILAINHSVKFTQVKPE